MTVATHGDELDGYRETLQDLRDRSKPFINMLTILAEENHRHGTQLVSVIENHIYQVPQNLKLPSLYLIDSILKNVKKADFRPFFRPKLGAIFEHVFHQAGEKDRNDMFKLRQSWTHFFDQVFLSELDRSVKNIDPKWPVTVATEKTADADPAQMTLNSPKQRTDLATSTLVTAPKSAESSTPAPKDVTEPLSASSSSSSAASSPANNVKQPVPAVSTKGKTPVRKLPLKKPANGAISPASVARKRTSDEAALTKLPRIPKKLTASGKPSAPSRSASKENVRGVGRPANRGGRLADRPPMNRSSVNQRDARNNGGDVDRFALRPHIDGRPPGPLLNDPPLYNGGYRDNGIGPMRARGGRMPVNNPYAPRPYQSREPRWPRSELDFNPLYDYQPPVTDGFGPVRPLPGPFHEEAHVFTPADRYEQDRRDIHERLRRGEITSATHQQQLTKLKSDFELKELQEAVICPILPDGTAPGRPFPPSQTVYINGVLREVRWYNSQPIVIIDDKVFAISFRGPPVKVSVDHFNILVPVNEKKELYFGTRFHEIRLGGPHHELVIDNMPFRLDFGGETMAWIDGHEHRLKLSGPAPVVHYDVDKPITGSIFPQAETANEDMISKILSSPAFQQLLPGVTSTSVSSSSVGSVVPSGSGQPSGEQREEFPLIASDGGRNSPTVRAPENLPEWWRFLNRNVKIPDVKESHDPIRFVDDYHRPELKPEFFAFEDAKRFECIFFYTTLRRLRLPVDLSCRLCEQRFLPGEEDEAHAQNIRFHNWWTKKEKVHTGDWMITEEEFVNEKSLETDVSAAELVDIFTEYILRRDPSQKLLPDPLIVGKFPQTTTKVKLESNDPDESVLENPIATKKKSVCHLCTEEIASVDEDDEWILRDAVRVTNIQTGGMREYHRDCFEDVRKKTTEPEPLVLQTNSRWGSSSDKSTSAPSSAPTSVVASSSGLENITGTADAKQDFSVIVSNPVSVTVSEKKEPTDSEFVFTEEDDEEDAELMAAINL